MDACDYTRDLYEYNKRDFMKSCLDEKSLATPGSQTCINATPWLLVWTFHKLTVKVTVRVQILADLLNPSLLSMVWWCVKYTSLVIAVKCDWQHLGHSSQGQGDSEVQIQAVLPCVFWPHGLCHSYIGASYIYTDEHFQARDTAFILGCLQVHHLLSGTHSCHLGV